MKDIDTYKLNKIFTAEVENLTAEQEERMAEIKANKTTPRDYRFTAQNQSFHCWNRYNEWLMCLKTSENDEEGCKNMRGLALRLCPSTWTEKWDEERVEGNFAGLKV